MTNKLTEYDKSFNNLFESISSIIEQARTHVARAANLYEVYSKFLIGSYIVDFEQSGFIRADYGSQILTNLSEKLTERYGQGWSRSSLKTIRQFYLTYSKRTTTGCPFTVKHNVNEYEKENHWLTLSNGTHQAEIKKLMANPNIEFKLSWSHYLILMRVENESARSFYEIESAQQQWSKRQLSRQVGSSLYERLALSRNKDEVMRLASEGQTIEKPSDLIKNPITLEFLGLKPEAAYSETKLENAIIDKMQNFYSRWAKGFSSRQGKRGLRSMNKTSTSTLCSTTDYCNVTYLST